MLSGISLITPDPPPISTLSPILRCPDIPAWPPILTFLPIMELPAMPTWPATIEFSPILTLELYVFDYLNIAITVFDIDPLSMVAPQPISQLSSIKTIPMWGYLKFLLLIGKNQTHVFH